MTEHHEGVKAAIDLLSVGVVVGTLSAALPPIAALLTIVWTLIRIWETETVKVWTGRVKRD